MGRLVYTAQCSLDGFTEDRSGSFGFTRPSEQVHRYINDRERSASTYLFGRRMYQTMEVWESDEFLDSVDDDLDEVMRDFAQTFRAADKVVYSRTLASVDAPRTRIVRDFDPVEVRALADAASGDVSIGGPELAAHALRAGIVDAIQLMLAPVIIGGGKPALPSDVHLELELIERDQRSFDNGWVAVHYSVVR